MSEQRIDELLKWCRAKANHAHYLGEDDIRERYDDLADFLEAELKRRGSAQGEPVATRDLCGGTGHVILHAWEHDIEGACGKCHPAERAGVPGGWQPIETAPKDGTTILATGSNWGMSNSGRHYAAVHWEDDNWYGEGREEGAEYVYLTHWQTLVSPDAPSEKYSPTAGEPEPGTDAPSADANDREEPKA